jgi:hypothetical protein
MKGNSLLDWVVKLIFGLMLLPFFFSLAGQLALAVCYAIGALLVAVLPWIVGLTLLVGIVSGAVAGLIIRGRLPRGNQDYLPPGGPPPVKRPRGPGREDDD